MAEYIVAIDVTRVRFPADAYVIDIADTGEQKTQQGEIKLKQMIPVGFEPTIPGSVGRCLIYPLGHGSSWLTPARQVVSWLTPASNTQEVRHLSILGWRSEAARGPPVLLIQASQP